MKKSLICLFLIFCSLLSLCACGSLPNQPSDMPFDKLLDSPSIKETKDRYGKPEHEEINIFGNEILTYSFNWMAVGGELTIAFEPQYVENEKNGYALFQARWTYTDANLTDLRDNIIKELDGRYSRIDESTWEVSSTDQISVNISESNKNPQDKTISVILSHDM